MAGFVLSVNTANQRLPVGQPRPPLFRHRQGCDEPTRQSRRVDVADAGHERGVCFLPRNSKLSVFRSFAAKKWQKTAKTDLTFQNFALPCPPFRLSARARSSPVRQPRYYSRVVTGLTGRSGSAIEPRAELRSSFPCFARRVTDDTAKILDIST